MTEPTAPGPGPTPPRRRIWPAFLVPALFIAAFLLTWRIVNEPRGKEGSPEHPLVMVQAPALPDGSAPISIQVGDDHLKGIGAKWSADPVYTRWLNLVSLRHLVAAAQLVADGENVRVAVPFISIPGGFAVREAGKDQLFIAPANYARYELFTRAVGSIDAGAAGDAYAMFRPFCDSAFAEIGRPGKVFDEVLTAAVMRVVGVKLIEGDVELVPKGAVYAFKDPAIEGLSAAEKQVLRMGPKNGAVLQRQLKVFAEHAKLSVDSVR